MLITFKQSKQTNVKTVLIYSVDYTQSKQTNVKTVLNYSIDYIQSISNDTIDYIVKKFKKIQHLLQ